LQERETILGIKTEFDCNLRYTEFALRNQQDGSLGAQAQRKSPETYSSTFVMAGLTDVLYQLDC